MPNPTALYHVDHDYEFKIVGEKAKKEMLVHFQTVPNAHSTLLSARLHLS